MPVQVDYVEARARAHCETLGIRIPLSRRQSKMERLVGIAQQAEGSLDSGPVICDTIERIIRTQEVDEVSWTMEAGADYRGRMAAAFHGAIIATKGV